MYVNIHDNYYILLKTFAYHEKSECVSNSLHEEFVLPEVLLIDIEHLRVVEVAHEEQRDEETDDHVYAGQCQHARSQTHCQGDQLAAPKDEVQDFILKEN